MALSNVEPTIFDAKTVFQALAVNGLGESGVSAISRGLRSALNPEGLSQFLADPIVRPGYSADTPALFYHPNRLSIDNVLLLSELNSGYGAGGFGAPDTGAAQVLEGLRENATIDSLPFIRNLSEATLQAAFGGLAAASILTTQAVEDAADEGAVVRGSDFTFSPSETQAFGSTYSSVASDQTLNSQFHSRFGLAQGGSISLDQLIDVSATGSPTHYAVSLTRAEGDNASGSLLDISSAVASDTLVLTAAELADYSYSAPTNAAWDFLSIIELEDADTNGIYEGRGDFNSIALVTGEETQRAYFGDTTPEETASYTFFGEAGVVQEELTLVFSGVNSAGYSDALAAIEAGAFRLTVSETLSDGSINEAVVDTYVSSLDEIKINFARNPAEDGLQATGINVELHVFDTSFDLSTVDLYARFA